MPVQGSGARLKSAPPDLHGRKVERTDPGSWRKLAYVISVPGLASSAYLAYHAAVSGSELYCPTWGLLDCGAVTSGPYSMLFGVNVAYLGLAWFVAFVALLALKKDGLLLPLWGLGIGFVAYLVAAEVLLIHSVCVYCTVAHASAAILGLPAFRLSRADT